MLFMFLFNLSCTVRSAWPYHSSAYCLLAVRNAVRKCTYATSREGWVFHLRVAKDRGLNWSVHGPVHSTRPEYTAWLTQDWRLPSSRQQCHVSCSHRHKPTGGVPYLIPSHQKKWQPFNISKFQPQHHTQTYPQKKTTTMPCTVKHPKIFLTQYQCPSNNQYLHTRNKTN